MKIRTVTRRVMKMGIRTMKRMETPRSSGAIEEWSLMSHDEMSKPPGTATPLVVGDVAAMAGGGAWKQRTSRQVTKARRPRRRASERKCHAQQLSIATIQEKKHLTLKAEEWADD